jgi:hypothetical protein
MSVGGRTRGSCLQAVPGPRDVLDALIRRAPLEVCLLIDDVHEIPPGSPGAAFLREVARTLPATAHLVLSGREAPDVPLARREATGEAIKIADEDLAFTEVEVRALARRLGRDARIAEPLNGWPAMVRLSLAAGPAAPWQYAREEVLCRVSDSQRQALAALAALGTGTARDLARAGRLACQARDWRMLGGLAVDLIHTTLSALPRVIAPRRRYTRCPGPSRCPSGDFISTA